MIGGEESGRREAEGMVIDLSETKLEETIGLIEDEDFKVVQGEGRRVEEMVEETAGRGDDHVGTLLQVDRLLGEGKTTKDQGGVEILGILG